MADAVRSNAALPGAPHVAAAEAARIPRGTRLFFALLLVWLGGLTVVALHLLRQYDVHGDPGALHGWILLLMCFYLTLCNTFVPLPTAWIILLAAAPQYALVADPLLNVALVSGLATFATILANLTEYHLLAYLLHFGLGARLRRTRVVGWAMRWFDRAPFQLLTLLAFVPLPVDAVRWLAILRGYSRVRFALAYLVGRGPRYLLFAGCSVLLSLGGRDVLFIQLGLIAAALVGRVLWRWGRKPEPSTDAATLDAALATHKPA